VESMGTSIIRMGKGRVVEPLTGHSLANHAPRLALEKTLCSVIP
jgi:hypothetical protein